MSTELQAAFEGLDPSVFEAVTQPEVLERLNQFVAKAKEPLEANKNDVLGKYTSMKNDIQALGGLDVLKGLAQQAADAKAKADAAALQSTDVESIRKTAQEKIDAAEAKVKARDQRMLTEKVTGKISSAIRDAKGDPELLEHIVRARVKSSIDDDGNVTTRVMNEDGTEMLVDGVKPATIKDLVAQIRGNSKYSRAFDADTKGGSGAKGFDAATQGIVNPFLPATKSFMKQNEMARANPALAMQMAAAAGLKLVL